MEFFQQKGHIPPPLNYANKYRQVDNNMLLFMVNLTCFPAMVYKPWPAMLNQ
jgi:hypothetical protein